MSESNQVNKLFEVLKNKHHFSEDLLISHPNQEEIKNKSIRKAFSTASKTKKGKGKNPGKIDIYYCNEKDKFLFLVEVKPKISQHEEAIEDIKHYLSFFQELSSKYKIIGLAFSGDIKNKPKIDAFVFKKGKVENANLTNHLLNKEEYLAYFKEEEQPIEYGKIRKTAQELNETFRQESWGLGDKQKPFFISACLLAFKNDKFRRDFFQDEEYLKSEHNVSDLVSFCKWAIELEIDKLLAEDKATKKDKEIKEERYESLKNNLLGIITKNQKLTKIKNEKETYFASILQTIKEEIYPHFLESREDIIGHFYHEFLKYSSNSDGKVLGIVLTPSHIAELFCDLSLKLLYPDIEENKRKFQPRDKVLDICCGTGTFLVSGFSKGISNNNLYGIELDADICDLALTNMILRGDGRTNIYSGSCFNEDRKEDDKIEEKIKEEKCNIGFLNPPYSLKKSEKSEGKSEIEFVHHLCSLLKPNSYVFAIVPLSTAIGTKHKEERKAIMEKHTLLAVMKMPKDLFSGNSSGSHTCVMVWKTGNVHTEQTQTWLANWDDDGFINSKGKRFDRDSKWQEIKKKWVKSFNEKPEKHISTFQTLSSQDCWLADAWLETNYSKLTPEYFRKSIKRIIKDYLSFRIATLEENEENI